MYFTTGTFLVVTDITINRNGIMEWETGKKKIEH